MDLFDSPGATFSSGPPRLPARQPTTGQPQTSQRQGGPKAALEALDAELDQHHYATTLSADDGDTACLTIANRHAGLSEDVYCDGRSYYWPWGQKIAATGNPQAAASKIRYVLAAAPGHTRD